MSRSSCRVAWAAGAALILSVALLGAGAPAGQAPTMVMPSFGTVTVYAPAKPAEQVVLFISGDGGWNLGVVSMAETLRDMGALVAGIDIRRFQRSLEANPDCAYPAGPLEELSQAVQRRSKLDEYRRPILVGYSSGATLVYAALVAAPANTFAGAISLGFCPDLEIRQAPCQVRGLKATKKPKGVGYDLAPDPGSSEPWMVLQGEVDQVCAPATTQAFVNATGSARLFSLPRVGHGFAVPKNWEPQMLEAYRAIAARQRSQTAPLVTIPGVGHLPVVEVPATAGPSTGTLAVLLSGDGGWAELDREIAAGLAGRGTPVVGLDTLRYFWTPRTPESAAADLATMLEHYQALWRCTRVILVGYSFGADALPFVATRLPAPLMQQVERVVLLGLSETATFTFHVTSWLGGGGDPKFRTVPEVQRLAVPVTCVRGADETDSACSAIERPGVSVVTVGRGHHFSGDYRRLVEVILNK